MPRPLLCAVLFSLAAATLTAGTEPPFTCEVIRPASSAAAAETTAGGKHRAVNKPVSSEIDVMEIYGPQLLHDAGSAEGAAALVQNAIDTTNQALSDSGLDNVHLRLRHVRFSPNYDTFPTPNPDADLVADRAYYGADLVGFAVGTTPVGFGAFACRPPSYDAGCGFHWVQSTNFLNYPLAYAHEVGHNLGADHDAPNAAPRDSDVHPYARAHCEPGQFRTIMSYSTKCSAPAVLLYSNPLRTYEDSRQACRSWRTTRA